MQKELQTAYQRWEMASFGDDRPSTAAAARRAVEEAPPPIPLPTEQELAAIREAARAEGFAQGRAAGHAEGLASGRQDAAGELQRLRSIADAYGQAVARADETIANDVLELALHLARGMVRTAFDVKPDLILPVVREAIDYLPNLQQPALLMLHPEDALIVKSGIGHELDKTGWRIVEDESMARGGCRVDTASNQIDAQLASRWQRLTHALGKDLDWLE
jgi:flagellar assembly protein FliH